MSMGNVCSQVRFAVLLLVIAATAGPVPIATAADAAADIWRDLAASVPLAATAPRLSHYRLLQLDLSRIRDRLTPARHGATAVTLTLPLPEGGYSDFMLADSHTMPNALQDAYPDILSLAGNDGAGRKARIDLSPRGLDAMVFDNDGMWVVRPERFEGGDRYLSFRRSDVARAGPAFVCSADTVASTAPSWHSPIAPSPMVTTGATLREYRTAVAANHWYVAAVGNGTVPGALAEIVTAINRVNQVYESEFGVHLTLIPNENLIIFPNEAGDPYPNDATAVGQNQTVLDTMIGDANYDIGHVFTTAGGGVAFGSTSCLSGAKALGTTGLPDPQGDMFYINFVSHELGHQFGANHTFNSETDGCGGGNREPSAAYEPGSGSTIMAYAGLCAVDDLQPHGDPYFHAKSLEEIYDWLEAGGGACANLGINPDTAPFIDTASVTTGYTIPRHTPFALSASATDANGDPITYAFEQYDLGDATSLAQGDTGNGPIFRSFLPTTTGSRTFPAMASVLGAPLAKGEAWPETTRSLNFHLVVRDNHVGPGTPRYAITTAFNEIHIDVNASAGPFVVTQPGQNVIWQAGQSSTVTWNVAGTDMPPVQCANVAIALSTDGGMTFAHMLASTTPNTGSATVTVPDVPDTVHARVRVSCATNVFFDVSHGDSYIGIPGDRIFTNGFDQAAPAPAMRGR